MPPFHKHEVCDDVTLWEECGHVSSTGEPCHLIDQRIVPIQMMSTDVVQDSEVLIAPIEPIEESKQ